MNHFRAPRPLGSPPASRQAGNQVCCSFATHSHRTAAGWRTGREGRGSAEEEMLLSYLLYNCVLNNSERLLGNRSVITRSLYEAGVDICFSFCVECLPERHYLWKNKCLEACWSLSDSVVLIPTAYWSRVSEIKCLTCTAHLQVCWVSLWLTL